MDITYTMLFFSDIVPTRTTWNIISFCIYAEWGRRATDIKRERKENEEQVQSEQWNVFGQSILDEACSDEVDEVAVQNTIHNGEDDLLTTVPNQVQVNPSVVDLKASWHPDDKHADVHRQNYHKNNPLEPGRFPGDHNEEPKPIEDDLKEELDLKCPKQRCAIRSAQISRFQRQPTENVPTEK